MRNRTGAPSALTAAVAVLLLGGCAVTESTAPQSTSLSPATTTVVTTALVSPQTVPATTSSTQVDPPVSWTDRFARHIEQRADDGEFSGCSLIGAGDEIVWQLAAGLADRDENRPNGPDTLFNLGSMNKMFTAVAVLQLVEQGGISVDDTIATVWPDYPDPAVAEQVTIHQLLTHTSGLGDTFTSEFAEDPNGYRSNVDYLPLFAGRPLLFEPGTSVAYSNAGFVILGLIIEKATGQDYYDYVRDHVFEPAGMSRTDSYALEDEVVDLAMGYTAKDFDGRETGVLAENAPLMPGRGFAAGGGYSTCGDLFRFGTALVGHSLLSAESTRLLLEPRVELAPGTSQGYGFLIGADGSVGHTGGAPGVCSFMSVYPETGHTVVVLSNSDEGCLPVLDYVRSDPPG